MQRFVRRTTPATESRILKLKGLPYATKEGDLQDFFQNFKLLRVALVSEPDGRPSGLAFAEFESSEEAVRAMSARNGDYIGDRYVKLLRVPPEEMEEQTGMGGGLLGSSPSGGMLGTSSGFAMQPGFAQGPGSRPQQPGQMRPAAWGQTNAPAEQSGFGQQQGQPPLVGFGALGQQQGFGLAGQQGAFGGPGQGGWSPMTAPQAFGGYNPMQPQQQGPSFNGHQQNMFSGNGLGGAPGALGAWAGSESEGGALPLNLPQDNHQKPIAILIAEQQAAIREAQRAVATAAAPSYQQAALGSGSASMPQFQQQALPAGGALGMGMGMGMGIGIPGGSHPAAPPIGQEHVSPGQHGLGAHHPAGSGSFGSSGELAQRPQQRLVRTDGSTIKVRGLPFRAAREEILAFFDGYGVLRDTLFLGTDGRGRPSGEGWLTFETPEEALRCARERNRQYLGSRYLELSLC